MSTQPNEIGRSYLLVAVLRTLTMRSASYLTGVAWLKVVIVEGNVKQVFVRWLFWIQNNDLHLNFRIETLKGILGQSPTLSAILLAYAIGLCYNDVFTDTVNELCIKGNKTWSHLPKHVIEPAITDLFKESCILLEKKASTISEH